MIRERLPSHTYIYLGSIYLGRRTTTWTWQRPPSSTYRGSPFLIVTQNTRVKNYRLNLSSKVICGDVIGQPARTPTPLRRHVQHFLKLTVERTVSPALRFGASSGCNASLIAHKYLRLLPQRGRLASEQHRLHLQTSGC